jgi:hypothetical protein
VFYLLESRNWIELVYMNFGFKPKYTSIHNLLRFFNGKITRLTKNIYEMGQFILEIAGSILFIKDRCILFDCLCILRIACAPNVAFMDMG